MPNPLNIYLGQPIDQITTTALRHTINRLRAELATRGHNIYSPAGAWEAPTLDPTIDQINRHVLDRCDVLVAVWPPLVPSIGLGMEIEYATQQGKTAIVMGHLHSQALTANPRVTVVDDADGVLDALDPIHAGMDNPNDRISFVLSDGADLPRPAYRDDAGIDLITREHCTVPPGGFADVNTTIQHVQLPPWSWGMVTGRSSTLRRRGLLVPTSVIDAGWRGPLFVGCQNLTEESVDIAPGERIGQLVILDNATARCTTHRVEKVQPHQRGHNGFGSTGN